MKLQPPTRTSGKTAFSLAELLLAVGILGMSGQMIYLVLNNGMISFARNSSVNVAHQEARTAATRLVRDIHAAVSVPQLVELVDNNGVPASASTYTKLKAVDVQPMSAGIPTGVAGVSFQIVGGGPFNMKNDPGNAEMIQFYTKDYTPAVGERLIMPLYGIEEDITKVTGNGPHANIWLELKGNKHTRIKEKKGTFLTAYITRRSAYVVANGELRFYPLTDVYPESPGRYFVVARYITSSTPFSVPVRNGAPDSQYVGVKLVAADPTFNKRQLKSVNTLIDTAVPYRAKLANKQ